MYLHTIARVEGPNLVLRLIVPDDAAYVYGIRTNPSYNSHLSQVSGTIMDQREWIINYKAKEAKGEEFYYVIERKDGKRCGLVRIYDIEAESFTWGSWILDENKTRKAALESAVLSFGIGFDALEKNLHFWMCASPTSMRQHFIGDLEWWRRTARTKISFSATRANSSRLSKRITSSN
ncbi:GNAT family N-acetyltransferase [Planktomarina temperata]|nr:GNAT family N-acetyltransferase [Planktomarina temperata]